MIPMPEDLHIESERLFLRPITSSDTPMVLEWRNSERTRNNFYYRAIITAEEHEKWLKEKVATGLVHQFIVCLKDTGEAIGCVYLQHYDPETKSMESGVFMSEKAPVGKGYAGEAVEVMNREYACGVLGLSKTFARVLGYNEASRSLHERAGFKLEEIRYNDVFLDDKWQDTYVYIYDRPYVKIPCIYERVHEQADLFANLAEPVKAHVPGSKSITNRALLLGMLSDGECKLSNVLFSDDSEAFLECVEKLGFDISFDKKEKNATITGNGGKIPVQNADINVRSAGTAARFLTALLGISEGSYRLDASDQMKKRPMGELLETLRDQGCVIDFENGDGLFPYTLHGHGFGSKDIEIDIEKSSQFLSALLAAAPLSDHKVRIIPVGDHGMAYVDMTVRMMEAFGVKVSKKETSGKKVVFEIAPGQVYGARSYDIEPDASAAAYFYAACPILGVPVMVPGVHFGGLQGDTEFIHLLEKMGCHAEDGKEGIRLDPPADGHIRGIEADMHACSDQAITLAAVAVFADSPVTIKGISHISLQESDRIAAIIRELGQVGIKAEKAGDGIRITPGKAHAARIDSHSDHRMAMGFSLIGLRTPGIVIGDPSCCKKTFPDYFEELEKFVEKVNSML